MNVKLPARQPTEQRAMSSHTDVHVQEVVQRAHEELRQLMRHRLQITRRLGTVKQTIVGLATLFGDGMLNDELLKLVDRKPKSRRYGLTQACREALMEASKTMTARDVLQSDSSDDAAAVGRTQISNGDGHHNIDPARLIRRGEGSDWGPRTPCLAGQAGQGELID
jgi:Flp pilus assembly protein TadD